MNGLLRYFVEHRTAANLLMALMLLAGAAAATQIRAQFFPDVVIERVTVRVAWDGAGPDDVDRSIVEALEPRIRAVDGVAETRAVAREGSASIRAEFEPDSDMGAAVDEIKSAVEGVASLPDEAEEPTITRGLYRDRVTNIVIAGGSSLTLLDAYAEELRNALFRAGVTRVTVDGAPAPRLVVEPDEAALERYGLTLREIAAAVAAEVESRPAGALAEGGARVRAGAERKSIDRLRGLVLKASPDGSQLTLGEVASIRDEAKSSGVLYYVNGAPAVQLRVDRNAEGDAIKIQRTVEETVAEFNQTLPDGVAAQLTRTRAQAISDRLAILWKNGLSGLAIVLALLFLFLSARTALWVSAGIPVAMMATVAFMWIFGLSLNMISLFALIICLGIVVDDAIVVGEHADTLARRGMRPADAAAEGARRMAAPVFSASVTTVIAFSALMLVSGRFGDLVSDLPKTVSVVLLASLVESFVILPAHMRHALAAKSQDAWYDAPSRLVNRGYLWFRDHAFRPFMRLVVRLRYPALAGAIALLLISVSMLHDRTVRWRFFNAPERGTIQANLAMLPGAKREDTFAMLEEMRRALETVDKRYAEEHGTAPVVSSMAKIGGTSGRGLSSADTKDPDELGAFELELIDPDFRAYSASDFIAAWRQEIQPHPMLETLAVRGDRSGPGGDAIDVELSGGVDAATLKRAAEALKQRLAALEGVSALEDSMAYDKAEMVLTLTPKGEALGFTTETVGAELRARLEGVTAAKYAEGAKEASIVVSLPDDALDAGFLYRTRIPTAGGASVPLSEVVEIRETQGFASVKRSDGRRVIQVNGDVAEDAAVREAVATALSDEILPAIEAEFGVSARQGGLTEQERDFLSEALMGFFACLAGIYLTLCWIFASWVRPLVVMTIIPFGLIGAIWGHYIHGVPLSMFSVVGLMGMTGIIINDSIVLVTTIDERARRQSMAAAVIDGAAERLRAVMLTTLTTVGGLAPLLFETSRQALFLKPTVITLAYGLGFGMVLVLIVTPALIMLQHDVRMRLRSARRLAALARRRRPRLGGATPPVPAE